MSELIPFDSLSLRAVVLELQPQLRGGIVRDVRHPTDLDLYLQIHHAGKEHWLLISADPNHPRLHLVHQRPSNAPAPSGFCSLLRKELEGRRLAGLIQSDFDRALALIFHRPDHPSRLLLIELMGRHSNIMLLNGQNLILDAIKHVPARKSSVRTVLPHHTYIPPPLPNRLDPTELAGIEDASIFHQPAENVEPTSISNDFIGISSILSREIVYRARLNGIKAAWRSIFGAVRTGESNPVIVSSEGRILGAYPLPLHHLTSSEQSGRPSFNQALEEAYGARISETNVIGRRLLLRKMLLKAIADQEKILDAILVSTAESTQADRYRQIGEILTLNAHQIPRGATVVELPNLYAPNQEPIEIVLRPELGARENAENYFHRYRKARDGAEYHNRRHLEITAKLASLKGFLPALDADLDEAEFENLERKCIELLQPATGSALPATGKEKSPFKGHKIGRALIQDKWEVLYGLNAESNDYLTTRLAAPNDLWLHVRAATSAHVIIRSFNRPDSVPIEVIKEAAEIAAKHSPTKHSHLVSVDYTLKKYVHKPRGASPGTVAYQREKTLMVSPLCGEKSARRS